jgi:hypothetical protein
MESFKIVAVCVLLGIQGLAFGAEDDSYQFANLSWGADKEGVISKLSQNYTYLRDDEDGDLAFTGSLAGESVSLIAYMSNGSLARVIVAIDPDENEYLRTYKKFKSLLSDRYGRPVEDIEFYNSPYEKGDGYEEQAIRLSKGFLMTEWSARGGDSTLAALSTKAMSILVIYDTAEGEKEEGRRSAESASDL